MKQTLSQTVAVLQRKKNKIASLQILSGFDGFVDTIVRAVQKSEHSGSSNEVEMFSKLSEFGKYIMESKASIAVELRLRTVKAGGNMPCFASAIRTIGAQIQCIGAVGDEEINPVFIPLVQKGCRLIGIAEPGSCTSIEFNDGKLMLSDPSPLDAISWDRLRERIPESKLLNLLYESNATVMVN